MPEQPEQREEDQQRWWMSRRSFLSSGALGAAAVALGSGVPTANAAKPTNDVDAMVLQVATVAAVYPVRFKGQDREPVSARLTSSQVGKAWTRCSAARVKQAQSGAQLLLDRDLGGAKAEKLLDALGAVAATSDEKQLADLKALVAVAAATLADTVDPDNDLLPKLWLSGLANRHNRLAASAGGKS